MTGMKVGRDTSFDDIYDKFKRSSSMGSSQHLRFSEGKGLYTHASWKLSGWGRDALANRESKWKDAAGEVRAALVRQYGERFADELFQSLDLNKGVTGLDLDRIKRATARFEDASVKGHTDESVRFNKALGELDKIDLEANTKAYKAELKTILRDFGRGNSAYALNLPSGLGKRLRAIKNADVDRMSVEDLKLLRDATLAEAHDHTKQLLNEFQVASKYWSGRNPDLETIAENMGITDRARGIDHTRPELQSEPNQQPVEELDTSKPVYINRAKASAEFSVFVENRLNANVCDDVADNTKYDNGIHGSAINDFGRTKVTFGGKVISNVVKDHEVDEMANAAKNDLKEAMSEKERRVVTSVMQQGVFEPVLKGIMDLPHYRPMPFVPMDEIQPRDPERPTMAWDIQRYGNDGKFKFKVVLDKPMKGAMDLQGDQPGHFLSDKDRSRYQFELTGIIDTNNDEHPVRLTSNVRVGFDHHPLGNKNNDDENLASAPSGQSVKDERMDVRSDAVMDLKKGGLNLDDDAIDDKNPASDIDRAPKTSMRNDSIGDVSDSDSEADPDAIGADFSDKQFPAISDAVDLGYVNCFDEAEMDKLKNELLERAGQYRYPAMSKSERHQARQFIQKTLEDWNWMAPKERDSQAQKMKGIPELHEVLNDVVQVISTASRNTSQDKLTTELGKTDDERFVLLSKGVKNYKANVLHELKDDKRDISGDATVVDYFKQFTKLNSGKGDLTNDQADEVLRLAFNLNQHLKTLKGKVQNGPNTLSELNRGLGRIEQRFNPKLEENFSTWLDDKIRNEWPNHCGKEELQLLLRVMNHAVTINQ